MMDEDAEGDGKGREATGPQQGGGVWGEKSISRQPACLALS